MCAYFVSISWRAYLADDEYLKPYNANNHCHDNNRHGKKMGLSINHTVNGSDLASKYFLSGDNFTFVVFNWVCKKIKNIIDQFKNDHLYKLTLNSLKVVEI